MMTAQETVLLFKEEGFMIYLIIIFTICGFCFWYNHPKNIDKRWKETLYRLGEIGRKRELEKLFKEGKSTTEAEEILENNQKVSDRFWQEMNMEKLAQSPEAQKIGFRTEKQIAEDYTKKQTIWNFLFFVYLCFIVSFFVFYLNISH